jgi:hypothetical protein
MTFLPARPDPDCNMSQAVQALRRRAYIARAKAAIPIIGPKHPKRKNLDMKTEPNSGHRQRHGPQTTHSCHVPAEQSGDLAGD